MCGHQLCSIRVPFLISAALHGISTIPSCCLADTADQLRTMMWYARVTSLHRPGMGATFNLTIAHELGRTISDEIRAYDHFAALLHRVSDSATAFYGYC